MAGIYLHIPFCKQACHYCDFHFSTNVRHKEAMLQAMAQELRLRRHYMGNVSVSSIYLGGGTPSLLSGVAVEGLLGQVTQLFNCQEPLEVTLEANPDDITLDKLAAWRAAGINRLSIGIQSFQDDVLTYLHRAHNSQQALASVALARKVGFDNLSIDLMYALPGVNQAMWEHDLATAMALHPPHVSAYCLTIEKKTAFGRWQQQGKLKAVTEEVAAEQFETLVAVLTEHQYEHYEVSNFSQPGCYARHNTNYWKRGSYLGIGPGAHSYDGQTRQQNVAHNGRYVTSLQQGTIPCTVEVLSRADHINEYIMTGLRTQWGCDLSWLKAEYGYDLQENMATYLQELSDRKLAVLQGHTLCLTNQGKLLADRIAADLFVA